MNVPNHVAIIMDGNGRWAQERGLKRSEGHKEGAKTLEKLAIHAKELGIKVLSVFAFSTDNFKRSKEEVDYLMNLCITYFNEKLSKVIDNNVKIVFSGRQENLRKDVLEAMENVTEKTKNNTACILNICFNYGGQEEIVDATKKVFSDLKNGKLKEEDLNKENFYQYMYQNLPPIDFLIRTGKEHRLSGFMLYQATYAELYFVDTYFPDFLEKDLEEALEYYSTRDRRFGNVKTD